MIDTFSLNNFQRIEDERDRLLKENAEARVEIDRLRTESAALTLKLEGAQIIKQQQRLMIESLRRQARYARDRSQKRIA